MKPGDPCRVGVAGAGVDIITYHDAIVHLVVDGRPVAVAGYDGVIDGFALWLPVLWSGDQAATLFGTPLEIVGPEHMNHPELGRAE